VIKTVIVLWVGHGVIIRSVRAHTSRQKTSGRMRHPRTCIACYKGRQDVACVPPSALTPTPSPTPQAARAAAHSDSASGRVTHVVLAMTAPCRKASASESFAPNREETSRLRRTRGLCPTPHGDCPNHRPSGHRIPLPVAVDTPIVKRRQRSSDQGKPTNVGRW